MDSESPAKQYPRDGRSTERRGYRVAERVGCAHVAQLAEHVLGKDEVSGSIPLVGSRLCPEQREGEACHGVVAVCGDEAGRMRWSGSELRPGRSADAKF